MFQAPEALVHYDGSIAVDVVAPRHKVLAVRAAEHGERDGGWITKQRADHGRESFLGRAVAQGDWRCLIELAFYRPEPHPLVFDHLLDVP